MSKKDAVSSKLSVLFTIPDVQKRVLNDDLRLVLEHMRHFNSGLCESCVSWSCDSFQVEIGHVQSLCTLVRHGSEFGHDVDWQLSSQSLIRINRYMYIEHVHEEVSCQNYFLGVK